MRASTRSATIVASTCLIALCACAPDAHDAAELIPRMEPIDGALIFSNATYLGSGRSVTTNGTVTNSTDTIVFADGDVQVTRELDTGAVIDRPFAVVANDHGYFDVLDTDGAPNGDGYCKTIQCHLESFTPFGSPVEQTFTFAGELLLVVGHFDNPDGSQVAWEVVLFRDDDDGDDDDDDDE